MKNKLPVLCLLLLIWNTSFSQVQEVENNEIKYFDENYKPITEEEYEKRRWEHRLMRIQGDSSHHKILSVREYHGILENRKILDSLLSSATNKVIDSSKTIVIIYYPGKDRCNSSGLATKSSARVWNRRLKKRLYKITGTEPVYIYKNKEGLEKYDGIVTWHKDPNGIIEKTFFKYHYPCQSFVAISKEGNFISLFGEFSKEDVWKAAEVLEEK